MATQNTHSKATKTNKPDHKPDHKPEHKPAKQPAKPANKTDAAHNKNKLIAIIIAAVAAITVIILIIVFACIHNNSEFVVTNGQGEKITTAYHAFDDDQFRIKIPVNFTELNKNTITEKYGTEAPNYVYSDADNNVNITIKITDSELQNDQVLGYLKNFEDVFNAGGSILTTDSYQVGDHNVATIELNSESIIGDYYNHMMFFSQSDRLVVISFNCPTEQQDTWRKVGQFILKSLTFQN